MRRKLPLIFIPLLLLIPGLAKTQMRNNFLFKVDPAGLMFRELRVSVEKRIRKDFFAYVSPHAFHQTWLARDNEPFGRPQYPQKYYAVGIRLGVRKYLLPKESSPEGLFVQGILGYRHTWLQNFNDNLDLVSRHRYYNLGFGGMVGYQKLYGPGFVPRKNFAYGVMAGFEFMPYDFYQNNLDASGIARAWYQFPFFPPEFSQFRFYLGVELGFAFLQRRLHW
jgi:hypothetical protein